MELQIFKNAELGSVRSTMINGEPYFVGKDVAEILGYADPNQSIAMHVDEDDKLNDKSASSLGQRGGWFINESGLYSLILSSKLPTAKRFKRWVTSEVLPTIRRHGLYAVDDILNNPDALIGALQAYKAERMQRLVLEAENAIQKQQLIEMQACKSTGKSTGFENSGSEKWKAVDAGISAGYLERLELIGCNQS